ncbi:hypothetical protein [Sphaerotilus sulfidivorans]|nr:hypothetical protein [Sphaerotilus sulfidivorans]
MTSPKPLRASVWAPQVNFMLKIISWFSSKSRPGKAVDAGLNLLDTAIGFGLVSVAAVAAVFGKFLLGGLLAALALGVFVRLKRRTKS